MPARKHQLHLLLTPWQWERLQQMPDGDRSEYVRQALTEKLIRDDVKREQKTMNTTTTATRFAVWGCGAWPGRSRLVDAEEPMDLITEDMPEFALLPATFVAEWEQALGSEHWAEIITCHEADLDAATRFSPSVSGYAKIQ